MHPNEKLKINPNIVCSETLNPVEINYIIESAYKTNPNKVITDIIVNIDGEMLNLEYKFDDRPIERIRRITGYLVGTLDRFNNAKKSEVKDRIVHDKD